MSWRVYTMEADGEEAVSSDLGSERNAISFACDLLGAGLNVAMIEGPDVRIVGEEVLEACAGHRRVPAREWPKWAEAQR